MLIGGRLMAAPKKKKQHIYPKPKKRIDKEMREEIRLAYLTGKSIDDICKIFNITKNQFNALRTRHNWKEEQREIDRLTHEQTIEILAEKKSSALLQIANDSVILMSQAMKRLKDDSEYDDIIIENDEGQIISRRKTYSEMYALARMWSLGASRLLRAVGEPDSLRDFPQPDDDQLRPVFKVLVDVGLKPEYREKLINGEFNSSGKK